MHILLAFFIELKFNKWVTFSRTYYRWVGAMNYMALNMPGALPAFKPLPNQDSITYQLLSQSYYLFCTRFHCTLDILLLLLTQ